MQVKACTTNMKLFTSILYIDNCPVEYRISARNESSMLLFIPLHMSEQCEMPPIFYVKQIEGKWKVLNVHDQKLIAQVLEQIKIMYPQSLQATDNL